MKFLFEYDSFCRAVSLAASAVPGRTSSPLLKNLYFEITHHNGLCKISGGNGSQVLTANLTICVVSGRESTQFILLSDTLTSIIRSCRQQPVSITVGSHIIIESPPARFQFNTQDATTYPTSENEFSEMEGRLRVKSSDLAQAIDRVLFVADSTIPGRALEAPCMLWRFDVDSGRLLLSALDGRRMVTTFISCFGTSQHEDGLIAVSTAKLIRSALRNEIAESEVVVSIGTNRVQVKTELWSIVSPLVQGEFPAFQVAWTWKSNETEFHCQVGELQSALRQVSIVAQEESKRAEFQLNGNLMKVASQSAGIGSANSEAELLSSGQEISFFCDPGFLLDFCGIVDSDTELTCWLRSPLEGPWILCAGDNYRYVVALLDDPGTSKTQKIN